MEEQIKVLVVDDDASTRETYKEIFSWAGFEVLSANDGEAGYELIKEHRPNVVFTGIEMPKMSGFELVEKVRGLKKDVPKMVINSHTDREEDRAKAEELKVDGYFVRGFAAPKNVVNHIYKITGQTGLGGGKILVVDDDASTRETYKEVLRWAGFETYEATNGKEAMDMMETVQPNVVFTGIMMPKMNGFELVRNIRKLSTKQPFVIINSHTDNEDDRKQAAQLGVDGYFVRGFSAPRNVVNHIKRLLSEYEPRMVEEDMRSTPAPQVAPRISRDIIYLSIIVVLSLGVIIALLYLQRQSQEEVLEKMPTFTKSQSQQDSFARDTPPMVMHLNGTVVKQSRKGVILEVDLAGNGKEEIEVEIASGSEILKSTGIRNEEGGIDDQGSVTTNEDAINVGDSLSIRLADEGVPVDEISERTIKVDNIFINLPFDGEAI